MNTSGLININVGPIDVLVGIGFWGSLQSHFSMKSRNFQCDSKACSLTIVYFACVLQEASKLEKIEKELKKPNSLNSLKKWKKEGACSYNEKTVYKMDISLKLESKFSPKQYGVLLFGGIVYENENILKICIYFDKNKPATKLLITKKCGYSINEKIKKALVNYQQFVIYSLVSCSIREFANNNNCGIICHENARIKCDGNKLSCKNGYEKKQIKVKYDNKEYIKESCFTGCENNKSCEEKGLQCKPLKNKQFKCVNVTSSLSYTSNNYKNQDAIEVLVPTNVTISIYVDKEKEDDANVKIQVTKGIKTKNNTLMLTEDDLIYKEITVKYGTSMYNLPNLKLKLYKKPTKISVKSKSKIYIYPTETYECLHDGILPKSAITTYNNNYSAPKWKVPIFDLNKTFVIKCSIKYDPLKISISKTEERLYTEISDFHWTPDVPIISINDTIECNANFANKLYYIDIFQTAGPSQVHFENKFGKFDDSISPGFYEFVCYVTPKQDNLPTFVQRYKFMYQKPITKLCFKPEDSKQRFILSCLHNQRSQGFDYINFEVKGYSEKNDLLVTFKDQLYNTIVILPNDAHHYRANCSILSNKSVISVSYAFELEKNTGILKSNSSKSVCNSSYSDDFSNMEPFLVGQKNTYSYIGVIFSIAAFIALKLFALAIYLMHIYNFNEKLSIKMTINGLTRHHCVMRLYVKLIELAIFRAKNVDVQDLRNIRRMYQTYKN